MAKQPMKDIIVLLPGILGSVLERDGDEVWAPSPGAIGRALWRLGRNLNDLALAADPWESDDLGDGVRATRLMPDVHIVPGFWGIDGYSGIASMIRSTFDVTDGVNFFELPYDWRRDNRVAARALKKLADESLHARRKDVPDAKLVLIGHSMGGLVSRYYLECLDGWRDTRALITFGTPYRGSINAVDFLANGFVKKVGPLKLIDLSKLLHSLTSVYQLLPVYPCIDLGEGYVRPAETADRIPGLDESRAKAALQFHHDIRDGTASHPSSAYAIHSIVGITQGTKQSARLDDGRMVLDEKGFDGEDRMGDGTVPRVSATPIETDDWGGYQPMYSSDKHGSLQNDDAVRTQLAGILTERSASAFRGDEEFDRSRGIPVDLAELLSVGEPLDLRAGPGRSGLTLAVDVVDLATGRGVFDTPILLHPDADGFHTGVVPPLPSGDYRVRVAGVGDSAALADPVHSLLCVFDDVELE